MKPTIIGGGDVSKPTVISITTAESKQTALPTPTVIQGTESISHAPTAITPTVEKPSAMPGQIRKRIAISKDALRKKLGSSDAILQYAISIIESINQDELTSSTAVLWGQSIQERHNLLVENSLKLAQSEVVVSATQHLHRMIQILSSIDLNLIFTAPTGFIANMLRKRNDKIDTPEEFDAALIELGQLAELMKKRINELIALRTELEKNSSEIEKVGDTIESFMIAALTLADYFNTENSRPDIFACFEQRAMSLTTTLGHIRTGSSMRSLHIEHPIKLTTLIQETVFNTLPNWMTSVAALRTALDDKKPNPTEMSEFSRQLKTIIQKLS